MTPESAKNIYDLLSTVTNARMQLYTLVQSFSLAGISLDEGILHFMQLAVYEWVSLESV